MSTSSKDDTVGRDAAAPGDAQRRSSWTSSQSWLERTRGGFERAAREIEEVVESLLKDEATRADTLEELAEATRDLQRRVAARGRTSIGELRERAATAVTAASEELVELREGWERAWTETPEEFGDRLRAVLADEVVIDSEWAHEQATRVAARLNAVRAPAEPLIPVVIWSERYNAWTLPGRYIYLTRELQQTMPTDDAVAFVVAHEMAHHDLGHLGEPKHDADADSPDDTLLARLSQAPSVSVLVTALQRRWMRPQMELEADARALELCEAAGYDRARCLGALDAIKKRQLDLRRIENAYGLDAHPEVDPDRAWRREQWRQRFVGYPSTWERKQRLVMGLAPHETELAEEPAGAGAEAEAEMAEDGEAERAAVESEVTEGEVAEREAAELEPGAEAGRGRRRRIPEPPEYL